MDTGEDESSETEKAIKLQEVEVKNGNGSEEEGKVS